MGDLDDWCESPRTREDRPKREREFIILTNFADSDTTAWQTPGEWTTIQSCKSFMSGFEEDLFMVTAERLLRTQEVADALGVSVSTIKRWVDSGALVAAKTVGKHRLVSVEDAVRFAKSKSLPSSLVERLRGLGETAIRLVNDEVRDRFARALVLGSAAEGKRILIESHAALGSAVRLAEDLIRPVMERLGHEWETGVLDIFQEHRATRIVEAGLFGLIARHSGRALEPGTPLAMGATPAGDHYSLSGLLAELSLRELGWDVINLGTNLPLASLSNAARAYRPRLVWLSVNHLSDSAQFERDYSAFYSVAVQTGCAVCLGGNALDPPLRSRLLAASFGDRLAHLVEFARGIAASRPLDCTPTTQQTSSPELRD
jgi:excisionase family DNA binding protein